MREKIRQALARNIERGEGQRSFVQIVNDEFDKAGRSRLKSHQIANIYTTNTATAFAAGQMTRMLEVQEDFPFWQFSAVMDSRTRPSHASLHGKIFRVGDFTFYPPLDYQCRCTARLLTARQAGKYPRSAMPSQEEKNELYAKAGRPEFAGNKQANYIAWLEKEYKAADPASQRLIDQATETMKDELRKLGAAAPRTKQEQKQESIVPPELSAESAFVNGAGISYKEEFFKMLDKERPIRLVISQKGKGAYFSPSEQAVHIVNGERAKASTWYRERVVYHELGHAIDWQRDMHRQERVQTMLKEWQRKLGKKGQYKEFGWGRDADGHIQRGYYTVEKPRIAYVSEKLNQIYSRISRMGDEPFERRGISKSDVLEQIAATQDTIKAINVKYGWGHTTAYFRRPGLKEAEFIAHCFENKFAGNTVFRKYLPDLYQATIEYIEEAQ